MHGGRSSASPPHRVPTSPTAAAAAAATSTTATAATTTATTTAVVTNLAPTGHVVRAHFARTFIDPRVVRHFGSLLQSVAVRNVVGVAEDVVATSVWVNEAKATVVVPALDRPGELARSFGSSWVGRGCISAASTPPWVGRHRPPIFGMVPWVGGEFRDAVSTTKGRATDRQAIGLGQFWRCFNDTFFDFAFVGFVRRHVVIHFDRRITGQIIDFVAFDVRR